MKRREETKRERARAQLTRGVPQISRVTGAPLSQNLTVREVKLAKIRTGLYRLSEYILACLRRPGKGELARDVDAARASPLNATAFKPFSRMGEI